MASASIPVTLQAQLRRLELALGRLARRPGVAVVHDARVAARRFRALLRGLDGYLNPPLAAQLEFELRAVGRTLAPLRDADVRRAAIADTCRVLLRADPALREHFGVAVAACLAALDEERRSERRMLRATLQTPGWRARQGRLRALTLDEALVLPVREPLTDVLVPAIARRWRRLQRDAGRDLEDLRRLHRVRIHAKVARYLIEEWARAARRRGIPAAALARRLQNALGERHDLLLLRRWFEDSGLPPGLLAAWSLRAADSEHEQRRQLRRLVRTLRKAPAGVATGTG